MNIFHKEHLSSDNFSKQNVAPNGLQRLGLSAVLIFCVTSARYCRWVKIES